MIFHHQHDRFCWHIDNQFYCGDSFIVAPVLNPEGVRDVYLPQGEWVDFWTGKQIRGPVILKQVKSPLQRIPVYVIKDAEIRVYPEKVLCTDEMNLDRAVDLTFDDAYKGFSDSLLGKVAKL
jgi:alpha-D-xyloside xylohydrolase